MSAPFKKEIPFIELRYYFIALSMAAIIASVVFVAKKGFNWGIDFKGGFKLIYKIEQPTKDSEIRDALKDLNLGYIEVQRYGSEDEKTFSLKIEMIPEIEHISNKITESLEVKFGKGNASMLEENAVGPKAGKELRRKGELAIIVACLLMLIYIGYRFDFFFAPGAIVALIHDVTIATGFFAFTQREVDLTVIAAFLTIIGYSINDTIVIYDRIRENLGKVGKYGLRSVTNTSLNETISRTLITGVTTLLIVIILFFLSEGAIQNFAFAMIIGIIVGTYSSLFIATPTFIYIKEHSPSWGEKIKKLFK